MANNETLGASFSIDVTDLKAGLSQANRLIRESESEFKAAAAGMDNWSDSQEGLEARIKHLNTATDLQRKKVDALQAEYDRLIADGLDPASREAVELRTKINKETEALNKNEAEIKKQTKALDELGEATDEAGEKAEDAGDGFTVMKGAAADLVANGITAVIGACKTAVTSLLALSEGTREFRENVNKLQTSFQTANLSAEDAQKTFTELYSILGDEGAATEAAQQLAKISKDEADLSANTRILTGVMAEYGASIPLEGLAEGIAASSAMSSVQGVLADALEWQGINLDDYNAKLESLKTAEERSAYIQQTLIDLYGESADLYVENNKSIIAARKATFEYNEEMAELGEVLEPVNADISELKTELARELAPVIKNNVAPAIKRFVSNLKESGTAQKFGKVIGYIADNFETLSKITLTAVGTFVAFNSTMKITTAITAATKAVQALSAGVGIATKAQVAWNAAMAANPIGAIISLVALLGVGIASLAKKQKEATKQTDLLNKSQRETVTAAKDVAEAFKETKKSADEMAGAVNANIDYADNLWRELQTLADANGKVKDSEKARADFIIQELNGALDQEYSMTGNIINNYKEMVKSIEKVIETKRAQMLLEAYEETYATAIEKISKLENSRAIQARELAEQQKVVAAADKEAAEAWDEYWGALSWATEDMANALMTAYTDKKKIADEESALLKKKQDEYAKTDAAVKSHQEAINGYETASTLILQGETAKAIDVLKRYGSGFQTAASVAKKSKEEQLEILRDQVINTEIQVGLLEEEYKNSQKNMTDEERKQAKLRIENAKKQATDAKDEYYKVGGNMIEGMEKGAEDGEWKLTGALKKAVKSGLQAAKDALGIKSPSRVFRAQVGKQIAAGTALGIADGTPSVVNAIKNQVDKMQSAYDLSGISANVGVIANRSTQANGEAQAGGVTVYQTNNFKQAYTSRIEQYKAKQELFAAARLMKAGAI